MKNVAIYARVSTIEQAKFGLSIDAQLTALRQFSSDHQYNIVGEYIDAGVSGKTAFKKRPALSNFMSDVESGNSKADLLLITKLDRLSRSVKLYYQAMEVLERHHVAWQAIQEDYETVTASGRMKVNIMLSVAENEADRTSERIKSVFDRKVDLGQPITCALPIGFKIDGKQLVPDENAPAAREAFEHYAANGNKMGVLNMLREKYGIVRPIGSITNMLQNRLYIGEYRDNKQFCEPIVPREIFGQVQTDLARRATRKTPSGRVYLLSGLIVCHECGRRMCSIHTGEGRDYYRCPGHGMYHTCGNGTYLREKRMEEQLLLHVGEVMNVSSEYRIEFQKQKRPGVTAAGIRTKLDRLKDLYVDGYIDKAQYKADREKLELQLADAEQTKRSSPKLPRNFADNFGKAYAEATKEERKTLWRAIVDRIEVGSDGKAVIFWIA